MVQRIATAKLLISKCVQRMVYNVCIIVKNVLVVDNIPVAKSSIKDVRVSPLEVPLVVEWHLT